MASSEGIPPSSAREVKTGSPQHLLGLSPIVPIDRFIAAHRSDCDRRSSRI